ncbi:DUF2914 domain-containing protein [Rheinheimera sp.]|uniref:DUF2914 domain-containing protein n=1 Tax=Rheinheimera sp. TaxID=1869214 RepID=UPI002FDE9748
MSEQSAKLRVKVTLHRDLPSQPPQKLQYAKAPLSKTRLLLGAGLMLLATFGLWQYWGAGTPDEQSAEAELNTGLSTEVAESAENAEVLNETEPQNEPSLVTDQTQAASAGESTTQNSRLDGDSAAPAAETFAENTAQLALSTQSNPNQTENSAALAATDNQALSGNNLQAGAATPQSGVEPLQAAGAANTTTLPAGFSRIVLAADMEQLEPGRPVAQLVAKKDIQRLYLFTELKGYAGQQLKHRWSFNGQMQTEAVLTIEDSPWRTYSEKWLLPDQLGAWRVEIIDQQQNVLYSHDFQYQ